MFLFVPYTIIRNCCSLVLMNSGLYPEKRILESSFLYMKYLTKIQPDILPALHVSTGFDLTRNVSTKAAALRTAIEGGGELLHAFGWSERTDDMIANAQKFLIRCLSPSNKCIHFDDLRYNAYHIKKFQLDLDLHISRYTCGSMEIWICGR